MRFLQKLLGVLFFGVFTVGREETFAEKLTVWPMPNKFNLLEFEYTFDILLPKPGQYAHMVDKFPR